MIQRTLPYLRRCLSPTAFAPEEPDLVGPWIIAIDCVDYVRGGGGGGGGGGGTKQKGLGTKLQPGLHPDFASIAS